MANPHYGFGKGLCGARTFRLILDIWGICGDFDMGSIIGATIWNERIIEILKIFRSLQYPFIMVLMMIFIC